MSVYKEHGRPLTYFEGEMYKKLLATDEIRWVDTTRVDSATLTRLVKKGAAIRTKQGWTHSNVNQSVQEVKP
jgi:hypothetical protein